MPRKRSPREPTTDFHMKTRSRNSKAVTPEPANPSSEDSSLSSLDTPPTTPPNIPSSHKRKWSTSSSDDATTLPEPKRFARKISASTALPDPAQPRKPKGRPPASRTSTAVRASKLSSSSPVIHESITPPDSTQTSRRSSRILLPDTIEVVPKPADQPQLQQPSTAVEPAPSKRRSLRNAKPTIIPAIPSSTAAPIQSSSSPNEGERSNSRKRKTESSSSDEAAPKRKRTLQAVKDTVVQKPDKTWDKDKELWPEFDKNNPTYYANDGATQYYPVDGEETPESRSPKKPARGGARGGRGGAHANGGGRKGRAKGKGGRGGSPDPPERKHPLTQEEKGMISILKARQHELKRFFSTVGAQQIDILEQMANRDLNRIAKKASAHKKVPEFDEIVDELQAAMHEAEDLARKRYDVQLEAEMQRLEMEKEVIEQRFRTHVEEARREHLAGAEGDIILFERAYRADHDEMHTESGSDMMDYFPRYHELPEPNAHPRGYSSSKIADEKPFKRQLDESYDEQARQDVLNKDVIGPLLTETARRNEEWLAAERKRQKSQTMDALSQEATKQLEQIEGYLVPRPLDMGEANSYALSALADVSEWVAQQHPKQQYIYVPLARGDTLPAQALDFSPLPGSRIPPPPPPPPPQLRQPIRTASRPRGRKLKYPPLSQEQAKNVTTYLAAAFPHLHPQSLPLPTPYAPAPEPVQQPGQFQPQRMVSSGPGQPIAPAPPKAAAPPPPRPNVNIFRHNTRYPPPPPQSQPQTPTPTSHSRHNSFTQASPNGPLPSPQHQKPPQQYIFQTPQQPYHHQAAPPLPPPQPSTPQYAPSSTATGAPSPITPAVPASLQGPAANSGPSVAPQQATPAANQANKMSMTFVNQTIASRNAAAQAAADGNGNAGNATTANGKGSGNRVLLPKEF